MIVESIKARKAKVDMIDDATWKQSVRNRVKGRMGNKSSSPSSDQPANPEE